jgi:hypothetical protein
LKIPTDPSILYAACLEGQSLALIYDWQHIFSTLTTHGRLSARDISQRCRLPLQKVLSGLAILTECLFVFHHTAADGRTSYQANQPAAFNLVRVGRFTQLMRRKFSLDGAKILKYLLIFGHDTGDNLQMSSELIKEYGRSNGFDEDAELHKSASIRRLLERLVEQKYLIELRPAHFQTWTDTWRAADLVVKASGRLSLAKGKKGQEELESAVREEMENILDGDTTSGDAPTNGKRAAGDDSDMPGPKRWKRTHGDQRHGVPTTKGLAQFNVRSQFHLRVSKY